MNPPPTRVVGRIVDGYGHHAANSRRFAARFEAALGYMPYPGTLNLAAGWPDLPAAPVTVDGHRGRIYLLWPARIVGVGVPCHAISWTPQRNRQPWFEVVAPVRIRDILDATRPVEVWV